MQPKSLTPEQNKVLILVSAGSTVQAAADSAGIHRNTILHWRRTSPGFQHAWDVARYEHQMELRDQLLPLATLAINVIREILENPVSTPSLRLRAALAVHKIVSTPLPAQPDMSFSEPLPISSEPAAMLPDPVCPPSATPPTPDWLCSAQNDSLPPAQPEWLRSAQTENSVVQAKTMHNLAQSAGSFHTMPPSKAMPQLSKSMHNAAQSSPKPGRNTPCPCNSGRKYKQCCLLNKIAA